MTVTEVVQKILEPIGIVSIVIIIGNLVKITPLQINFWSWLARKIGNSLNHDMLQSIEEVKKKQQDIEIKLDNHVKEDEEARALRSRQYILRFAREILTGTKHTQEEFVEVLSYIDNYEEYCNEHPKFPNNRAVLAKQLIKDNYQERLEKADFLVESYR